MGADGIQNHSQKKTSSLSPGRRGRRGRTSGLLLLCKSLLFSRMRWEEGFDGSSKMTKVEGPLETGFFLLITETVCEIDGPPRHSPSISVHCTAPPRRQSKDDASARSLGGIAGKRPAGAQGDSGTPSASSAVAIAGSFLSLSNFDVARPLHAIIARSTHLIPPCLTGGRRARPLPPLARPPRPTRRRRKRIWRTRS